MKAELVPDVFRYLLVRVQKDRSPQPPAEDTRISFSLSFHAQDPFLHLSRELLDGTL